MEVIEFYEKEFVRGDFFLYLLFLKIMFLEKWKRRKIKDTEYIFLAMATLNFMSPWIKPYCRECIGLYIVFWFELL